MAAALRFPCPACGAGVKAPPEGEGQAFLCPKCGARIVAPAGDEPARTVAAAGRRGGDAPASAPARAAPPAQELLRIVCRVCGGRIYLSPDEALRPVRCPDCDTLNPAPRGRDAAPSPSPPDAGDDDLEMPPLAPPPETVKVELDEQGWRPVPPADAGRPPEPPPGEILKQRCSLCATPLYYTAAEVGAAVRCPDCDTENVLRPPAPAPPRRAAAAAPGEDDVEFRLSDPVERPAFAEHYLRQADREAEPAPAEPRRPATLEEEALAKAEREARERREPVLPQRPLVSGVLRMFAHPSTLARLLLLALWLALLAGLIRSGLAMGDSPTASGKFGAVLCFIAFAILGVMYVLFASTCFLGVVVGSANGEDEITEWPDWAFLTWLPTGFYVINALIFCALAGSAIFSLFRLAGAPGWLGLPVTLLALFLAFPFLLLSMLENDSQVLPFSAAIWSTLGRCRRLWRTFYLEAACLAVLGVAGEWILEQLGSAGLVLASFWLTAALLLYFRLLGRLAWACQEETAEERAPGP